MKGSITDGETDRWTTDGGLSLIPSPLYGGGKIDNNYYAKLRPERLPFFSEMRNSLANRIKGQYI